MAMVTLIDRPDLKVDVRADVADQWEVCPICDGHPSRLACVGADLWGRWAMYQRYTACPNCDSGIARKRSR